MENQEYNSVFKSAEWSKSSFLRASDNLIIGTGGIGSHLAFQLARTGIQSLTLYDDDIVEKRNMGGQLFSESQIGMLKVESTKQVLDNFISEDQNLLIGSKSEKFSYLYFGSRLRFVFVCVDNMESRIGIARHFKNNCTREGFMSYLIESRLGPTGYEIFFVDKTNIDFYLENCLFSDNEANGLTCSFKQTTHVAASLASDIVTLYTNKITNMELCKTEGIEMDFVPTPFYTVSNNVLFTKECKDVKSWKKSD